LQGKFTTAYADAGRIFINSTLGVLGLFDIASAAGIEKHNEDFGQTLAVWGVTDGPYVVLPLLGPRTTRDVAGTVVDFATDPATYLDPTGVQYSVLGARAVDDRAQLLDASTLLHDAALDPYLFARDAYLQRRQSLVRDGAPAPGVIEAYGELRPAAATGRLSSSRPDDDAFSKGTER
jgi:phospholipid-binding lipoprotein MlaA